MFNLWAHCFSCILPSCTDFPSTSFFTHGLLCSGGGSSQPPPPPALGGLGSVPFSLPVLFRGAHCSSPSLADIPEERRARLILESSTPPPPPPRIHPSLWPLSSLAPSYHAKNTCFSHPLTGPNSGWAARSPWTAPPLKSLVVGESLLQSAADPASCARTPHPYFCKIPLRFLPPHQVFWGPPSTRSPSSQ